ncbi:AsmA family protein [Lichenicola cladoniae]|uniref:AsmA family protein n=1 Tax=Lichenicola cladoniae TaxID=1484109 RepID=A0A6M8HQ06_9PROT|nr:AsmA family protein [Lichenicola cladoniae]QKE90418.1 AsmA family protein [Lichenicola cladoniae]
MGSTGAKGPVVKRPVVKRRRGLLSRLLLVALVLLAIVVGIALVVQSQLDDNSLRLRIERDVLRQTGRRLTLGTLHVRLLPVPTIEADDIAFADWPGGRRPQMLTAGAVRAHVALLPLLEHVVRLEGLTLDRPDILLERAADGQANWQMHKPEQPAGDDDGSSGTHSAPWEIQVGSVRLLDGSVAWQDLLHGSTGAVAGLRADGSGLAGDHPAATLTGQHGGAGFMLDAKSGPLARLDDAQADGAAWPIRLVATERQQDRETGRLVIDGTFTNPARERGYALDVEAHLDHLDALNALFPHAALPAADALSLRTHMVDEAAADAPHGQPELGFLSLHTGAFEVAPIVRSQAPSLSALSSVLVSALRIDARDRTAPVDVALDGRWHDQALSLHGTAGTLAGWQGWQHGGTPQPAPLALDLSIGGATAQLHGTVGNAALDLLIAARAPSLRALLRQGPDLTDMVLAGHVQMQPGAAVTVSDLRLESHQLAMTGSASWLGGTHPTVTAALDAAHVDLDALRSGWGTMDKPAPRVSQPAGPAPSSPPAVPGPPGQVIPFAALRLADLAVQLDAHELKLRQQTYHDLVAKLSVQDGKLALAPFSVTGPAGPIAGQLTADADGQALAVVLQPSMISAESLQSIFGRPTTLRGVLELVAELHATGGTTDALLGTMSGHFGASLVNGAVSNASLSGLVGRSVGIPAGGETKLRCLAFPASVSNGVATLSTLALQTRQLDVQGHGTVALADGRLDLHLLPKLSVGVAGASLPVHVGGHLGEPQAALDPAAPGGRFALTIGPVGPMLDLCGPALAAARFGNPGPQPAADTGRSDPGRSHKIPKPIDILRGLGLFR